ncbi:MAG: response regulator [Bacteroidota bacterium]
MAPKILVLEDNKMMQSFLKTYLNQRFQVTVLDNPKKAIKALQTGEWPDLILLDLDLPVMHGWEFLDYMQKDSHLKQIPTIVLSGRKKSSDRIISLQKGASDYLTKPFNPEELMLRIQNTISTYRRSTEFVSFN